MSTSHFDDPIPFTGEEASATNPCRAGFGAISNLPVTPAAITAARLTNVSTESRAAITPPLHICTGRILAFPAGA
jgi:hypothetical protein